MDNILIYSVFLLSCGLTWLFKCYALRKKLLDIPNHRSSHTLPTPRGAGIIFFFCGFGSLTFLFSKQLIPQFLYFSITIAGSLIAILSFIDDRKSIPSKWRLSCHLLGSLIILYFFKENFSLFTLSTQTIFNILISIAFILYITWLINLYNFMDGIDGIAAIEFITVCCGMIYIYRSTGHIQTAETLTVLVSAVSGFLVWNFPPARVFMGDVGSTFLGLILAIYSLHSLTIHSNFFASWIILLAIFIGDATFTLLRRILLKQPFYESHQSHCYQILSRKMKHHLPVTLGVMFINLFWLFPLALLTGLDYLNPIIAIVIAYLPLFIAALLLTRNEFTSFNQMRHDKI